MADPDPFDRTSDWTWHLSLRLSAGVAGHADSLGWSYSLAGFMNTINAAGYLAGALGANAMIRRFGMFSIIRISAAACVLSLVISALTSDFVVFSIVRLLSGVAAAFAFVAGGALATNIAQAQRQHQAFEPLLHWPCRRNPNFGFCLAIFIRMAWTWYMVDRLGSAGCDFGFTGSGVAAGACRGATPGDRRGKNQVRNRACVGLSTRLFPVRCGLHWLHDFYDCLCARHRRWCANAKYFLDLHRRRRTCPALGLGHVVGEKPRRRWYRTANRNYCRWSSAAAFWEITDSIRCFRAHLWQRVLCSGFVNTAFVRFNYLREAWPKAIAMMTVAFGIGQVLGPIAIGAITDKLGSLSYALNISAATLVLGALACICQRSITPRIESANYGRETSRALVRVTSALPSKADMRDREQHVR